MTSPDAVREQVQALLAAVFGTDCTCDYLAAASGCGLHVGMAYCDWPRCKVSYQGGESGRLSHRWVVHGEKATRELVRRPPSPTSA